MQCHPPGRKTQAVLIPVFSTPAGGKEESVPNHDQNAVAEKPEAKRAKCKPKENRNRANNPKVRTGCITCKTRRVKCDERHDGGCARCEKLGVKCEGYLVPTKKDKPPVRAILPKLRATTTQRNLTSNTVAVEPISGFRLMNMLPGAGLQFSEEREYRYFRLYCEEIAPVVNGPMDPSIWSNVIPQASEKERFIVHAMVALGALSKAGEIAPSPKETRALPASSHLHYALAQYGKALNEMRKSLTGKQEDIRKAVIGCLLIFCFESWQSNEFTATQHACQIMELIRDAKTKVLSCGTLQLEEDFYDLLSGLDIHSLLYFDDRPSHVHKIYKEALSSKIHEMPAKLTTLGECRFYSQLLMRRNFHFTAEAVPKMEPPPDGALSRSILLSIDVYATTTIPPSLIRECDQYVQDIRRWERASEPVLLREVQRHDTSSFAFIISNLLYIHASMTFITLVETFYPGDRSYDGHLPRFRTIVSRAAAIYQQLTASRTSTPVFRFDIGIIPALSLTGMLCRHSKVRREAIELLQRVPNYREGIWQSRACAMVADWIREIEEEFMDEYGFVPRNRRASLSSCKLGFLERWGKMTARQRDGTDGGGYVMRDKVLRW